MKEKKNRESSEVNPAKGKLLKKKAIERTEQQSLTQSLDADDIGMVRVEFSVPASRLFGHDGRLTAPGGPSGQVAADNNTDDPVYVSDSDRGPNQDKVKTISAGPGHYDGID